MLHMHFEFGDYEENKIMMSFDVDFKGPLRQYTEIVSQRFFDMGGWLMGK